MKNWVERFWADTASELESRINSYCETYNCEPVSISAFANYGRLYAFVVMKEGEGNG